MKEEKKGRNPVFKVGHVEVPELPAWLFPLVIAGAIISISVGIFMVIRRR